MYNVKSNSFKRYLFHFVWFVRYSVLVLIIFRKYFSLYDTYTFLTSWLILDVFCSPTIYWLRLFEVFHSVLFGPDPLYPASNDRFEDSSLHPNSFPHHLILSATIVDFWTTWLPLAQNTPATKNLSLSASLSAAGCGSF